MAGTKEKAPRSRRRNGRGVLVMVTGLLVTSALVRLAAVPGAAIALEPPAQGAPAARSADDADPAELAALMDALRNRETRLDQREREIEDRLHALYIAETEIETKMASLIEAEERLRATIALADGASENDLARLTSVYENMKPKEAAKLFETMAPEFAAGFLGRMRPDIAAGIMAGLSANTAYSVSVILAGRNAGVPKE